MAEINLGAIRFNWKGAYAGGTAYVVDDVVSYLGSSYVCILASTGNVPTNGTYWNLMAQGGTGSSSTLTTAGDMLYRDGSGLQRLAIGTAGQELKVNSGASAPEWYTPAAASAGKILQVLTVRDGTQRNTTSSTYTTASSTLSITITPSATSSRIFALCTSNAKVGGGTWGLFSIFRGNQNLATFGTATADAMTQVVSTATGNASVTMSMVDSPATTSATTYQLRMAVAGSGTVYLNSNNYGGQVGELTLMEIGA
mgnify:FL=1